MTGGRVKRLEKYIKDQTFMLTYGDGLSSVNIKKLLKFHRKHKNCYPYSCETTRAFWSNKN